MMASEFLNFAVQFALVLLSAAFLLTVFKVIMGPTLPDRILALDMLVAAAIGFIAVIGLKTGYTLYVDIAIALGLVGFLATVAFARFVLARGQTEEGREKQRQEELQKRHDEKANMKPEAPESAPAERTVQKKAADKKTPAKKTQAKEPAAKKSAKATSPRTRKSPPKTESKS